MAERLPIQFTAADIPVQCKGCSALPSLSEDEQIVSDTVRRMQNCVTGPLEEFKLVDSWEIRTDYEEHELLGPDVQLLDDGSIEVRRTTVGVELASKCGLIVDAIYAKDRGDPDIMDIVWAQQDDVKEYDEQLRVATNPDEWLRPRAVIKQAVMQRNVQLLMPSQAKIDELNQFRERFGLPAYSEE
ncbi:MAG: hypothetical protein JWM81_949 [Candidatus Saccharibacteria bacterium]|nr:hypothetical protein [Candidatus Saccharibacteria bacterium]